MKKIKSIRKKGRIKFCLVLGFLGLLVGILSIGCSIKITEERAYSDAQKKFNFTILKPTFLPEDVIFSSIEYERPPKGEKKSQGFTITYYSSKRQIHLSIKENFVGHQGAGEEIDPSQTQLKIDGKPALVSPTKQGYNVEWFRGSAYYKIQSSGLSLEEVTEIARSMKPLPGK